MDTMPPVPVVSCSFNDDDEEPTVPSTPAARRVSSGNYRFGTLPPVARSPSFGELPPMQVVEPEPEPDLLSKVNVPFPLWYPVTMDDAPLPVPRDSTMIPPPGGTGTLSMSVPGMADLEEAILRAQNIGRMEANGTDELLIKFERDLMNESLEKLKLVLR